MDSNYDLESARKCWNEREELQLKLHIGTALERIASEPNPDDRRLANIIKVRINKSMN
jgi:hypothetical protein